MLNFLKSLFMPPPASGALAKERLRLVLLSDHLSLAPDVVDALKRDLLDVISRYVEIDFANADVTFEHREREVAMLASIPIIGVRDRPLPDGPAQMPPSAGAPAEPAPETPAVPEATAAEPEASATAPDATAVEPEAASAPPATLEAAAPNGDGVANGSAHRRRRRKKARAAAAQGAGSLESASLTQGLGSPARA